MGDKKCSISRNSKKIKYFLSFLKGLKNKTQYFKLTSNPREFGKYFSKNQSRMQDVNLKIMEDISLLNLKTFEDKKKSS